MIYSILTDVDGQAVDLDLLSSEILASGAVSSLSGMTAQGDILEIDADVIDQAALDLVVKNHDTSPLLLRKKAKVLEIDTRTRVIIAGGFTFDGQQFSLSAQAQTNWLGLVSLQSLFTWPVNITTNTDTAYALAQANVVAFVATGCGTIAAAIGSGRALKIAVNACATKEDLAAVVDAR